MGSFENTIGLISWLWEDFLCFVGGNQRRPQAQLGSGKASRQRSRWAEYLGIRIGDLWWFTLCVHLAMPWSNTNLDVALKVLLRWDWHSVDVEWSNLVLSSPPARFSLPFLLLYKKPKLQSSCHRKTQGSLDMAASVTVLLVDRECCVALSKTNAEK